MIEVEKNELSFDQGKVYSLREREALASDLLEAPKFNLVKRSDLPVPNCCVISQPPPHDVYFRFDLIHKHKKESSSSQYFNPETPIPHTDLPVSPNAHSLNRLPTLNLLPDWYNNASYTRRQWGFIFSVHGW